MRALSLTLTLIACGADPILEKAEALAVEDEAASAALLVEDAAAGGEPGEPGEPDELVTPGVPEEPTPAPPGTLSDGVVAGTPEEPAPAPPGTAGGADTGAVAVTPGVPEEPTPAPPGTAAGADTGAASVTPGVPEEPEPGQPGAPGGAEHEGKIEQIEGPQIKIKGRIDMDPSILSKVYIDVFDGDQRNIAGERPSLVRVVTLQGAGTFEIEIPVSAKRVWLSAYADTSEDNRPTKGEPTGWYSGNPIFLDSPPSLIVIELVSDKKDVGLGLDFGR
jgi:hypothetical protein